MNRKCYLVAPSHNSDGFIEVLLTYDSELKKKDIRMAEDMKRREY